MVGFSKGKDHSSAFNKYNHKKAHTKRGLYMSMCVFVPNPCQRGILAFQGSHGNLLQKTSLRCWATRDYGLNDPKAEMFNLPSSFDGFMLFFLAMAIGTLFLTVQFSFLFPEYPFCSRNCVCIRNKNINMTWTFALHKLTVWLM